MRPSRRLVLIAITSVALASCGETTEDPPTTHSRFYKDTNLRVGSHSDQPGIGLYDARSNRWTGMDVSVATYIMTHLQIPFSADNSHIAPVQSADRENHLHDGTDDLIIASYSITDARIQKGITFTIPYLLSFQDILIRDSDTNTIKNIDDLSGRNVCTLPVLTTPYLHLVELNKTKKLGMKIDPQPGLQICVDKLLNKTTDAVVADNAILFGYESHNPTLKLVGTKVWPRPEQYGVGLITKSPTDVNQLNTIIKQMIDDGSWAQAVITNFCPGSKPTDTPCRLAKTFIDNPPA